MADKPESIRVAVPESYGDAFGEGKDRQWIERRIRIGLSMRTELVNLDYLEIPEALEDAKEKEARLGRNKAAFRRVCEILADNILAWSLTDEDGNVLPDPWQNPDSLEELAEVSFDLFIWANRTVSRPIAMLVATPKN